MLLFNEIMTAKQALERGFVSQVIPKDEFIKKSAELIEKLSQLPKHVSKYFSPFRNGLYCQ